MNIETESKGCEPFSCMYASSKHALPWIIFPSVFRAIRNHMCFNDRCLLDKCTCVPSLSGRQCTDEKMRGHFCPIYRCICKILLRYTIDKHGIWTLKEFGKVVDAMWSDSSEWVSCSSLCKLIRRQYMKYPKSVSRRQKDKNTCHKLFRQQNRIPKNLVNIIMDFL